jgi:LPS-assembly protein
MTGFFRRPLAVMICCLFNGASVSHALVEVPSATGTPLDQASRDALSAALPGNSERPVRLRIERKFNVLASTRLVAATDIGLQNPSVLNKGDAYPTFIVADDLQGRTDEVAEATGNVELRKAGTLIFADKMVYQPLEDEVDATGQVRMLREGVEIDTPHLRMKLAEQIGFAENADYRIAKEVESKLYGKQKLVVRQDSTNNDVSNAPMMLNIPDHYELGGDAPITRLSEGSGHAERINFEGENQVRLLQATYSTCKPGSTDWYLQSSEISLDYDENLGLAQHASVWFKDVPLFYAPLASFSLNNQRRSGVLAPTFGSSTRTGVDYTVPYYWNIAPDYDVTFFPRYMSKRGFQLGAEGQYLGHFHRGKTQIEYMPDDNDFKRDRYAYHIEHQHNLGRGVSAAININGASDDTYFEDLSTRVIKTSQVQLPRQLTLSHTPATWLQTNMQVLQYQTLQPDPATPVAKPYFLEPQINLIGYKPNLWKTDFSMTGQYSRFNHPDGIDVNGNRLAEGDRFVFYPQLSLPIVNPAFVITPKIGLHVTQYDLQNRLPNEETRISRTLPTFSLDSTVIFERDTELLGHGFIQTLEPRLYYVHIPFKDQSNIPVFDSGITDFNFAQIFSENRYSGFDRINDANQLTAGVTSRMLDATTGSELFKAMIGQRYYFKEQRVTLPGETARVDEFSNLVAGFSGLVAPKTYVDTALEYNYRDSQRERLSAGVRFQPEIGKVLSASYRYTRDQLSDIPQVEQYDLAGQLPISAKWYAVGRYNYSVKDRRPLETIAGFEYNAGCWSARFVTQRLEAIAGDPNTSIFFQLELHDFGSIGSNPLQLLRRSIPGYGKMNELPNTGTLSSPE